MTPDAIIAKHLSANRDEYVDLGIGVISGTQRHIGGVDGRAIFRIASISKVFTSLALAAAVERGEIRLDDEAGRHLPGFELPTWHGEQILVGHLATHSAGFRSDEWPDDDGTLEGLARALTGVRLATRPGERWAYSNLGASLLANLLAIRAGTGFDELVRQRVCEPLGLHDTVLRLDAEQQQRLRIGHDAAQQPTTTPDLPLHAGAGGFYSTIDDLLTLLAAHVAPTGNPIGAMCALVAQPRLTRDGDGLRMGLGWLIDGNVTWHNGALPGYRSYAGFTGRNGVVVLTNTTKSIDGIGPSVLEDLTTR